MRDFLPVFFNNFRLAFLSSLLWVVFWSLAFFGSNMAIEISNMPEKIEAATNGDWHVSITALALTIAVISSHIPKLISYLMESGTDFQNVFDSGTRKSEGTHIIRLVYSSIFLISAFILSWNNIEAMNIPKEIFSVQFVLYSRELIHIILLIWSAQIVFSWPQEDRGSTALDSGV